jgi:hypothetical protein
LEEAWTLSRQKYAPPAYQMRIGPQTDPKTTKERRLENGLQGSAYITKARAARTLEPLIDSVNNARYRPLLRELDLLGLTSLLQGDLSQVYCTTFMRPEAYQRFLDDGVYRDVWSAGTSWHTRFHDRPLISRGFVEMRVFGERGDGVTYGYLTTCDAWQDEVSRIARDRYGSVEVYWKPERVVPFATATLDDSGFSQILLDAGDPASLLFAVLNVLIGSPWAGGPVLDASLAAHMKSSGVLGARFIEFQCHGPLTPDDVETVIHHDHVD